MTQFSGQTAIVTGASRGIGRAIAEKLAAEGANIIAIATRQEVIDGVAAELASAHGVKTKGYACDVSNFDAVQDVLKDAIAEFGTIEIVVNNAGITKDGLLMRMKEADFDSVVSVNLKSVFNFTKGIARHMLKNKFGRIINMTSINALVAQAGQANYAASKAGVIGLTQSNAKEFAAKGITVNAVAPGFIQSDMTAEMGEAAKETIVAQIPCGSMGEGADIANAVAFLASNGARYITGQVLSVDGGLSA